MAHIPLQDGLPGIVGLFAFSPETATALRELAEVLLRGSNSLTSGEREMLASYVSFRNRCDFCQLSHGAAAAAHFGGDARIVDGVIRDVGTADVSDKMKALFTIASKVQEGGKLVTSEDVAVARQHGATDKEVHDTVLIAAAFCMYNRYVDGLGTWQPRDPNMYREMGERMAGQGYVRAQ
ncbi:MAG TPA: peroxidase-related enzyme [Vicinamibacterales bacterium]